MKLNDLPVAVANMAPQAISVDVLLEKYAKGDESSVQEVQHRVARALAQAEKSEDRDRWTTEFFVALESGFVPAGRIASAAGTEIRATLINCFVQPVADSVSDDVDGLPGIYKALSQAAETMRRGGGVGYDFSRIRPKGAFVKGTHSMASGPVSYMHVFDRSCETVESAGARRGAQMGILRCDHPDVLEFVHSKDGNGLRNFNISVGLTDAFMLAVEAGGDFDLVHTAAPAKAAQESGAHQRSDGMWVYQTVHARDLMDEIVRATYDHADPGVVFLDRMNAENNLHYVEVLEATNPCAEQSLPAYGCCCLGSIDLTRFVERAFTPDARFAWGAFRDVVRTAVRMLDNVLDVTVWPLREQRAEAMAKRRIGLGFLGLGSALVMLGIRYNDKEGYEFGARVAETLRDTAYVASIDLAAEKGAFPLFDAEQYLKSRFVQRLPQGVRDRIAAVGTRNSHLLSIAPTGTISLAFADNASNGVEPAFSWTYSRKKRMADGSIQEYQVEDHAFRVFREMGGDVAALPPEFVSALEMTADEHMQMLQSVQPFIDSSISKTVNVPADYPFDDFKNLYVKAWKAGLKGLATYRPNAVTGSVLSVTPAAESASELPDEDPLTKQLPSRPDGDLSAVSSKVEYWSVEGRKTVFLVVSFARVHGRLGGKAVSVMRPVEFFVPAGQRDAGQQWISATMRTLSLAARCGISVPKVLENMREVVWDNGPVRCGLVTKADGSKAPRMHDSEVAAIGFALQEILARQGFLDETGRLAPMDTLLAQATKCQEEGSGHEGEEPRPDVSLGMFHMSGKQCPECGARALHKVDGCMRCANCNYLGSCG